MGAPGFFAPGIARLIWTACGLGIALLLGGAALVRQADLAQVRRSMDNDLALNAKGYATFVKLNLAIVDRQLMALRDAHRHGHRLPTQAALDSELSEIKGLVLQVALADAQGLVMDSSLEMPKNPVNIADRAHFRAFRHDPRDRLFISEPVLGRVSKKPSLQLVRPLLAPGGALDGVIVASIDPELLKTYFTDMQALDNKGRLSIVGDDAVVRFRLTSEGFSAGQSLAAAPTWPTVKHQPQGVFDVTGQSDGIERRVAFHQVEGFALRVMVSTGLREELQGFDMRWRLVWTLAAALSVVLVLVAKTISRLAREQKRSYGLMQESRARALESSAFKANFLASVSHELRTPLNSILGFSELIRDTASEATSARYAGLIHASGTRLHALVNTLLDLTKIGSGKMALAREPVDLPGLLQTLTAIHKVQADEKGVELSLSVDGVADGTVESDRARLAQILNNVIHNAIKFTPSGAIFVVLKPAGHAGLQLSVIDTGIGIAPASLAQVFERFNTIDAEGAGESGSGLGLALCRELLNLMGGTIALSSEVGHGTTVDIFIPHHQPTSNAA